MPAAPPDATTLDPTPVGDWWAGVTSTASICGPSPARPASSCTRAPSASTGSAVSDAPWARRISRCSGKPGSSTAMWAPGIGACQQREALRSAAADRRSNAGPRRRRARDAGALRARAAARRRHARRGSRAPIGGLAQGLAQDAQPGTSRKRCEVGIAGEEVVLRVTPQRLHRRRGRSPGGGGHERSRATPGHQIALGEQLRVGVHDETPRYPRGQMPAHAWPAVARAPAGAPCAPTRAARPRVARVATATPSGRAPPAAPHQNWFPFLRPNWSFTGHHSEPIVEIE